MLAQSVTNGFKHLLALLGEAAKDEDHLASESVDDLAYLLIVEHQVEELGDLQVVHCDRGFPGQSRDTQIGLGCTSELNIPHGDAIDITVVRVALMKDVLMSQA